MTPRGILPSQLTPQSLAFLLRSALGAHGAAAFLASAATELGPVVRQLPKHHREVLGLSFNSFNSAEAAQPAPKTKAAQPAPKTKATQPAHGGAVLPSDLDRTLLALGFVLLSGPLDREIARRAARRAK